MYLLLTVCFVPLRQQMEHPIQEELDGIESELLLVREELSELLKVCL